MKRLFVFLAVTLIGFQAIAADKPRKLVIIAGKPSHPPGMHEFRAGSLLLEKCLKQGYPQLTVEVHTNGWVNDEKTFADTDAIFIYADGGAKHPAVVDGHLETLRALMKKGVSLGCGHYGVEVVADQAGKEFKEWIGGHYENSFSCNPIWDAEYKKFPKHPIANGVKPYTTKDEWYFNMRFRDDLSGITPILVAKPSDATRDGPYVYPKGPYPHIQAAKGRDETMMWAVERADGGRGFGYTGGHFHSNWGNDQQRKVILNALVWLAKAEVPKNGVESKATDADLAANLDPNNLADFLSILHHFLIDAFNTSLSL